MSPSKADRRVNDQYENLPYPARDPKDETKRLVEGAPSALIDIIHSVFAGKRGLADPLRVLVAGGGTGDGTIMLAQHMADAGNPGTLDYVDVSMASRAICEERAAVRGLTNIRFHTASLLDIPAMALGPFDYIDCCGVLHHLDDPLAGLRALKSVLVLGGGMGLMVYAPYGRGGVYPLQDALQMLTGPDVDSGESLKIAKNLLTSLPRTNAFKRNPFLGDHTEGGDAGLYDLLLHSRDRAYTIAEFEALLANAGLAISTMAESIRYRPETYTDDPVVLERLSLLSPGKARATAEIMAGNIRKHVVYAVEQARAETACALVTDMTCVPTLVGMDGSLFAKAFKPKQVMATKIEGIKIRLHLPDLAGAIIAAVDGVRTAEDIVQTVQAETQRSANDVENAYHQAAQAFIDLGKLRLVAGGP